MLETILEILIKNNQIMNQIMNQIIINQIIMINKMKL